MLQPLIEQGSIVNMKTCLSQKRGVHIKNWLVKIFAYSGQKQPEAIETRVQATSQWRDNGFT